MKNQILVYFLIIFTFFSCNTQQEELTEMNLFLQANYEFNNRTLNKNKGDYYQMIVEVPRKKIKNLHELDLKFEMLISKIDSAIKNKESNFESIIAESDEILNEIPKMVNNRKDYVLPTFKQPLTNSNVLTLKYIKNRLVIAMAYVFEYASRKTYSVCGINSIKVDDIITRKTESGIKLTLTSRFGQPIKENRHIIIDKTITVE